MILKLKRTPGIYLVGFMGSGKSTVGRLLADELGWSFADIDEDIEKAEGVSIAEIFDTRGEARISRDRAGSVAQARARGRVRQTHGDRAGRRRVRRIRRIGSCWTNAASRVWLDCPIARASRAVWTVRPIGRWRAIPRSSSSSTDDRRDLYSQADYRIEVDTDDPADDRRAQILKLPIF